MLNNRPLLARVAPFVAYMAFLLLEQAAREAGGFDARWLYPVKVGLVAALLGWFWREYAELRERPTVRQLLAGAGVGVLVFAAWIHLDQGWLVVGESAGYDPRTAAGDIDWTLAILRLAGAALVVPLMEELFWRSFLARWIENPDFLGVAAARLGLRAILISSLLFGVEHNLWFAGIVAGLAYAGLYRASGNLWPPILAHAVTNLLLGLWVLQTGAWQFW